MALRGRRGRDGNGRSAYPATAPAVIRDREACFLHAIGVAPQSSVPRQGTEWTAFFIPAWRFPRAAHAIDHEEVNHHVRNPDCQA